MNTPVTDADGSVPPLSLVELRKWFAANKETPEFKLAHKHYLNMDPAVAAELRDRAPGEPGEEKELALMFALTQVAQKLELHTLLMSGIRVEHLPPAKVADDVPTEPERVAASHVDVVSLDDEDDEEFTLDIGASSGRE